MLIAYPRLERRSALFQLADSQRGYFTAAQAKALGVDYPIQHYHKVVGNWLEVMRGIYCLAHYPSDTWDVFALLTLWSHNRAGVVQAVVGFESALLLHGLGDVLPDHTHLIVPVGFRKKPPEYVVLHKATLLEREITTQHGVKLTTPLRTVLDLAGSPLSPEHLEVAVQQALSRGMIRKSKLLEVVQALPSFAQKRLLEAMRDNTQETVL
jgi:predicted transcriptional regulator of viral defense system